MKYKLWLPVLSALLLAVISLWAQKAPEPPVPAPTYHMGSRVDNLALRDLKGVEHRLFDLGKDSDLTVLMFIATQCPVSNAYNQRMVELDRGYAPRKVKFIAVNSNRQEPIPEIEAHAAKNGFAFTVYKDEGNVLADLFGASVTPEIYLFDKTWTMRYHGRIDDNRELDKVTTRDLRNVLDALLAAVAAAGTGARAGRPARSVGSAGASLDAAGAPPPVTETKAFGCTIKRVKK